MTTTVKVHVNGQYRATVTQDGKDPVEVEGNYNGGSGEQSFYLPHPADSTFKITEVYVADDDKRPAPIKPPTFGEKAVGLTFNPGNRWDVDACKREFAAAIDRMNGLRVAAGSGEKARLASVAITELQTAQMWAVKALTWQD